VLLAVWCGLAGAAFNAINRRVSFLRRKYLGGLPNVKVVEAVVLIFLVMSLLYALPVARPCRVAGEADVPSFSDHKIGHHDINLVPWNCANTSSDDGHGSHADGVAYNDMATLLMQPQESAIKQLFSRGTAGYFSAGSLALFIVVYFLVTVFIYGISVPSGLFVPCMLIGGATGRLVGELLHGAGLTTIEPGVYALAGAAGYLGGVTRMTMSLACIVLEISNDIELVLPIMISVVIAKQVGDQLTPSLYDIHIRLQGVPMLGADWVMKKALTGLLNARSVMATEVVTLHEAESPEHLCRILSTTTHNGYPLIDDGGVFHGLISRNKLEWILDVERKKALEALTSSSKASSGPPSVAGSCHRGSDGKERVRVAPEARDSFNDRRGDERRESREYSSEGEHEEERASTTSVSKTPPNLRSPMLPLFNNSINRSITALLSAENLRAHEQRRPSRSASSAGLVDLRPHCDRSPYVVNELLPLRRVFRLFTTMGLRHLVVVDTHSHVVGMITRKDFLMKASSAKIHRLINVRRDASLKRYTEDSQRELHPNGVAARVVPFDLRP